MYLDTVTNQPAIANIVNHTQAVGPNYLVLSKCFSVCCMSLFKYTEKSMQIKMCCVLTYGHSSDWIR